MDATSQFQPAVLRYRFGPYEVNASRNELRKFGLRIPLERKPWQVLIALLRQPGNSVSRLELRRALWGEDVFVDFEHGLNVAIAKLRAVLCDSPDALTYIETVAGEGYRFSAPVEIVPAGVSASPSAKPLAQSEGLTLYSPSATEHYEHVLLPSTLQKIKTSWGLALVVFVALIAFAILGSFWAGWRKPEQTYAEKSMLVVLPFANLSGDPNQEYLSDGMTEELSQKLGNLNPQSLGVIGRTSAMTYKNSSKTIGQIGKELAVGYVLEGSVRQNGNKLRVTAQLVKVSDQTHVWAQDYDGNSLDILQVEDDVASEIAHQVGISMAVRPPRKAFKVHIPNPEAHEAYFLARYYWNKRGPVGWKRAEGYFRQAIEKDSQYAPAYAGLAECRIPLREATAAASKAVELDPASGEARTALGRVQLFRQLDIIAAEETFKTAIRLDPNYAIVHHSYSNLLAFTGRFAEAISEKKQAAKLDPLSVVIKGSLAGLLMWAGQQDAAEKEIMGVFEMDPQNPLAHGILGGMYIQKRMYKEAIREFEASEANGGDQAWGARGYAYARLGDKLNALKMRSHLQELEKHSKSASVDLAVVEMGLGNKDEALAVLERVYHEHNDDGLLWLNFEPAFDPLHSDPRFQDLLRRMKLVS